MVIWWLRRKSFPYLMLKTVLVATTFGSNRRLLSVGRESGVGFVRRQVKVSSFARDKLARLLAVPANQDIRRALDLPGGWPWPLFEQHRVWWLPLKSDGGSIRARST